jgi:hypothetical protein
LGRAAAAVAYDTLCVAAEQQSESGEIGRRLMDRSEIEVQLNRDRAWLLETYTALPAGDLTRGVTTSAHDPATSWSARDHLAHLAGIEKAFVGMVRRHLAGDANPVGLTTNPDGTPRTMEQIMKPVNAANEEWVLAHRDKPLGEIIALGQQARAETLALIAELTDEQLAGKLPGAPWADGTIGGVLATNALHGRMHWKLVKDALAGAAS